MVIDLMLASGKCGVENELKINIWSIEFRVSGLFVGMNRDIQCMGICRDIYGFRGNEVGNGTSMKQPWEAPEGQGQCWSQLLSQNPVAYGPRRQPSVTNPRDASLVTYPLSRDVAWHRTCKNQQVGELSRKEPPCYISL